MRMFCLFVCFFLAVTFGGIATGNVVVINVRYSLLKFLSAHGY